MQLCLSEDYWNKAATLALQMLSYKNCFILGRGACYAAAKEGALKVKEITYMHAEAYPGGELKHGPFALIYPGMPIILFILENEYKNNMINTLLEVTARFA